jgi:hypothetical protein
LHVSYEQRGTARGAHPHQELTEALVGLRDVSEHPRPRMVRAAGPMRTFSSGARSGLDSLVPQQAPSARRVGDFALPTACTAFRLHPRARGKSVPCSARAQNELHQPIPGLLKLSRNEIGRLRG